MDKVYLLEGWNCSNPCILGIYSNKELAEEDLDRYPKDETYIIYEIELNKSLTQYEVKDWLGAFEHWHYGDCD